MHEIRLRGGWELRAVDAPDRGPTRLTLPTPADSLPTGRLRLIRPFNRPPRATAEATVLRLSRCAGIRSVTLNGRPVGPVSPDGTESEWRLGPLEPRNVLEIEAEPPRDAAEWGSVSLVFLS